MAGPAHQTPYEVLGVAADVDESELKRAYRVALRRSHPDTGGSAAAFAVVQHAWELVGDPDARARYDRGRPSARAEESGAAGSTGYAPRPGGERRGGSVQARSYGHPGGLSRQRYLDQIREWVGLGDPIDDPYDPALVHRAPRHIRRVLAEALAEEETARTLSALGMGFTVWNDVRAERGREKIDHVVLGPSGLYAVGSEDWGSPVAVSRGEVTGEEVGDETPLRDLTKAAKDVGRSVGVRFTGIVLVVPDEALGEAVTVVPRGRTAGAAVVRRSMLPLVLRDGVGRAERLSLEDVFEVRTRLQEGVVLV